MKISFSKMSGAGNDFVIIDNRTEIIRDRAVIARQLCERKWGIGADGLLLLENSEKAAYRMMYYNADGSYGGMCGNGGRCIAKYAFENGVASANHEFEALGHNYSVSISKGSVRLGMIDPKSLESDILLPITSLWEPLRVFFIDTGSPHVVIPREEISDFHNLEAIPLKSLGPEIRFHNRFSPNGTNVNVVELESDKSISVRTYERGVEAETLACGTGSVAAGIFAHSHWGINSPIRIIPRSKAKLSVAFEVDQNVYKNIFLTGPAIETFKGEIEIA